MLTAWQSCAAPLNVVHAEAGSARGILRPSDGTSARFEDVYAHKSHGPWLGHLVTWHTQDRPWTKPGDFLAMFEAKYQALLALRQRCGRDPKPGAAPNSDYKRAGA